MKKSWLFFFLNASLFVPIFAQEFKASSSGISAGEIYGQEGYPCPILVSLEQTQGERTARIELSDILGNNLLVEKEVFLSGPTKKRIPLYLTPFSLPTYFWVKITTPDFPPIEEKLLIKALLPPKVPHYLCYANRAHLFQFFNNIPVKPFRLNTLPQEESEYVPLSCQDTKYFVAQPEGYEHAQGIIFEDTQERFLLGAQRTALKEWVLRGGHLIYCLTDTAGINADFSLTEWTGWKLGELRSTEKLSEETFFEELGSGLVSYREVLNYWVSDVQLTHENNPFLLSRSFGAGRVSLLTLDIGRKPLSNWPKRERLVQILAHLHSPFFYKNEEVFERFLNQSLSQITNAGQVYILLGYCILILFSTGPLNYQFMKRYPKYWYLVLPTIVLLLGLLASLTQLRLKRTGALQVEIDFAYFKKNQGVQHSYLSLFSFERQKKDFIWNTTNIPSAWDITFSQEENTPVFPSKPASSFGRLLQEEPAQFKQVHLNPWGWRYFQNTQTLHQEKVPIASSLRIEDENLSGHLVNHTEHHFQRVLIIQDSPLNQWNRGSKKYYPPLMAVTDPLSPYAVVAFKNIKMRAHLPEIWEKTLSESGACPYSVEIGAFFESIRPPPGQFLLVGFSIEEQTSTQKKFRYFFIEASEQ